MKLIENFFEENVCEDIYKLMTGNQFAWFFNEKTSFKNEALYNVDKYVSDKTLDTSQFVHLFYNMGNETSPYAGYFLDLFLNKLGSNYNRSKILRFKANMICQHANYPEEFYNIPHVDWFPFETESLLYYVNDSDGDTVIFNERPDDSKDIILTENQRVKPKKNMGVLFDSSYLHASSPPRENNIRIVFNIAFHK